MKKITFNLMLMAIAFCAYTVSGQNNAVNFNGTDNVMEWPLSSGTGTQASIEESANFTWEFWVKGASAAKGIVFTEGWGGSTFRAAYWVDRENDKMRVYFRDRDASPLIKASTTTTVFDDAWHHVTILGEASGATDGSIKVYVDGVQDATDFGTYVRPTQWDNTAGVGSGGPLNECTLGNIARDGNRDDADKDWTWFDGSYDQFRVWKRALTPSEITDVANCTAPANSSNLFISITFDEGSGTVFANTGSHGTDGTLLGTSDGSTHLNNSNCATASVEDDVLSNGISIYPNPVSERLIINHRDASITIKSVSLTDLLGRTIYSNKKATSIDVSNYSKGVYLLKVESDKGGILSRKIIVD